MATTDHYQLKVRLGNWKPITNILNTSMYRIETLSTKCREWSTKNTAGYTFGGYNRIQRIKIKFEPKLSVFYFSSLCAQLQILHVLLVTVDSRDNITVAQSIKLITIDNSY
jgi:hypothetical protein